jgi:hypothetical protein
VRGKEEPAAEPQRLLEIRDARAQPEVRPEQVPAVALRAASAVLRSKARDASPEAAWGRRPGVRAHPEETAGELWAVTPEALLAVLPLAEMPAARWETSPMLGPEAEQRQDEQAAAQGPKPMVPEAEQVVLPRLAPQAEGLARVEAQVATQAVAPTQRLGLEPVRREPVQKPPAALSLEAEPPELRLPEALSAA